tara:strand:- start:291 stop:485 length:195 start_codon:yes stop_codon:yes gene_type:complete
MSEIGEVLVTTTGWNGIIETLRYSNESMQRANKDAGVLAQNISIKKVEVSRITQVFVHGDLKRH